MSIYLIRHTEIDLPKGMCYGQLDAPLKKTHLRDFSKIKKLLPKNYGQVISSPHQNCVELAKFLDENYTTDQSLLELNFGDWEGQLWQDINTEELKNWSENIVHARPKNGENLLELFQRVSQFFNKLRMNESENIVVVCHTGVIRCLIASMMHIPLERIFQIQVGYNHVYRFELNDDPEMDQWYI